MTHPTIRDTMPPEVAAAQRLAERQLAVVEPRLSVDDALVDDPRVVSFSELVTFAHGASRGITSSLSHAEEVYGQRGDLWTWEAELRRCGREMTQTADYMRRWRSAQDDECGASC